MQGPCKGRCDAGTRRLVRALPATQIHNPGVGAGLEPNSKYLTHTKRLFEFRRLRGPVEWVIRIALDTILLYSLPRVLGIRGRYLGKRSRLWK